MENLVQVAIKIQKSDYNVSPCIYNFDFPQPEQRKNKSKKKNPKNSNLSLSLQQLVIPGEKQDDAPSDDV
jgi:hypothetical protein